MAISAAKKLTDFSGFLTPEMSAPIFDEAMRQSVAQQLIPRTQLGINGQSIPIVTSRPKAGWVDEGGLKPATEAGLGLLQMVPKKLAAITVSSAEVVRADPGGYANTLRGLLAEAFAVAFDIAVLYGKDATGTANGPFSDYIGKTSQAVTLGTATVANGGVHADFVSALTILVNGKKRLSGFALDLKAEPLIAGAVDASGRPIYIPSPNVETGAPVQAGRLLSRPTFIGEGVASPVTGDKTIGFAGDWSKAAWGAVGGITFKVTTEAPVTIGGQLVSLWEHNLVAVLAEAEYGFVMADADAFVKIKTS